jgi:hypothetical protein
VGEQITVETEYRETMMGQNQDAIEYLCGPLPCPLHTHTPHKCILTLPPIILGARSILGLSPTTFNWYWFNTVY